MATVVRENIGLLNDKIVVTVHQEDYIKNFDNSLKKYAKQANIPGFRKGMVPTGVVKKMYGQSVFTEEVIKVAENELYNFLEKEKLDIFAQPLPFDIAAKKIDMNEPGNYDLAFEIGLKPQINIDTNSYNTTRYVIEVEDKMVEEEVERLRRRHGKMNTPETVSNEEDMLNITFDESDAEGNLVENGNTFSDSLLLKYFKEDFRKNLLGKQVNDSIVLQVSNAFEGKELDFMLKDLNLNKENSDDLNKYFKATITKIGFVELADLNEELFIAAFPNAEIKTEADFRNYVKEDIAKAFQLHSRNQLHDQLYHCLIDNTAIEMPESFLKRWLKMNSEKPKTDEEVETEFPSFANSLKWTIISQKIATDNNIKVENDDIKEFAKNQLFSYMGMGTMADDQPWVNEYINRMMKDKKFVEDSYYKIQTEKMFAVLESQVTPKEENISYEEFSKKVHNHHH